MACDRLTLNKRGPETSTCYHALDWFRCQLMADRLEQRGKCYKDINRVKKHPWTNHDTQQAMTESVTEMTTNNHFESPA